LRFRRFSKSNIIFCGFEFCCSTHREIDCWSEDIVEHGRVLRPLVACDNIDKSIIPTKEEVLAARKKLRDRQDHEILLGKKAVKQNAKAYVRELQTDLYEGAMQNYQPYIRSKENDESLDEGGDGDDDWFDFADVEMRYILTKSGMKRPKYDGKRNMFSLQQFMTRHGPIDGVRQFHNAELFQRTIHQRDVFVAHCKISDQCQVPVWLARGKGGEKGVSDTLYGYQYVTGSSKIERDRETWSRGRCNQFAPNYSNGTSGGYEQISEDSKRWRKNA
jgi:hypothetical protein